MLDNPVRVSWVDTCWKELRNEFPDYVGGRMTPENVCATVGFPPTRARGKRGERRGAYIGTEWKGNPDEKWFVSIHPERMKDGVKAASALVEEMHRAVYGARSFKRGDYGRTYKTGVQNVIDRIGEPPSGYAEMSEPQARNGSRLRKYECDCRPIRAATDKLDATCNDCGKKFKIVK